MDFGIFGFSPEQARDFRSFVASQQAQMGGAGGNPTRPEASASASANANAGGNGQRQDSTDFSGGDASNGAGAGNQQPEEPVLMHNSHHNGVVCDTCNTEIRGFRYKCLQCADFDLCSKCEHKGHHAGHIMMRIAFPEQARSAIQRYFTGPSPPPSPSHHGHHGHGHGHGHGHRGPHGHHGPFGHGHPFFARRGTSFCHRRGDRSSDGEDAERPATAPAPGCPYQMGKKEYKRWAKWMKRAATHQNRSAEAYARAAAASGTAAPAGEDNSPTENPMDFAAVASQIQEFLNYWGVPVDVVELYDQFGGQPGSSRARNSENPATGAAGQQDTNAPAADATANTTSGTPEQPPASPATAAAAANLSENMEQMRLDERQNNAGAATPREVSLLMDMDPDEWTIVNNHSREQTPGNSTGAAVTTEQQPPAPQGSLEQNGNQPPSPSSSSAGSMNSNANVNANNNGGSSTPFASAGSNASSGQPAAAPATTPSAPPTGFPAGLPNVPLYPVLNQPQIQQILQGVSSAVNSVVRSIPIVTDPRGPLGTNVTTAAPGQVPASAPAAPAAAAAEPAANDTGSLVLDARSIKTLNQLLAMGFSNEGGYLTRLVVAKKGDLEAVLSSLFPN